MFQINNRSTGEPFLFILKLLLLLAGLALTLLSLAFLSWGLGVAALFVSIGLVLKGIANFISPEKQAIKRMLNRSALIIVVGGLVFYGLLLVFSLLQ